MTDLYEFAWGPSFHFASRREGESFKASLLRYQRFVADRLSLKPGMEVLDVGCGVGGPMGNLARHSGAVRTAVDQVRTLRTILRNAAMQVRPGRGDQWVDRWDEVSELIARLEALEASR